MAQHWNDIIEYIKINLGAEINMIELSDDEMIRYLKNQVLSYFSQYSPHKKYLLVTAACQLPFKVGQPQYRYKLPVPEDEYIIDILEVSLDDQETILDTFSFDYFGCLDTVQANSFIDAIRSIHVRNTWEFLPPDILQFDQEIKACVVEYNVEHDVLTTVKPDVYHIIFKPLCLANVKLWIASMRSKYEGLQTPFGNINLNWQQLQQEGLQEKEKAEQMLLSLPPDKLIEISI